MKVMFKTYWRGLEGFRWIAAISVAATAISGLLEGTALMFLIPILGQGMKSSTASPLPSIFGTMVAHINRGKISLFLAFIFMGVLSATIRLFAESLMLYARTRLEESLRKKMGAVLFYVAWPYFLTQRLGNIGNSIITETTRVADGIQNFLYMLGISTVAFFFICISFMVSVPMTCFTFVFGAIAAGFYYLAGRRAVRHTQNWVHSTTHISEQVTEIFNNLKYIRASNSIPGALNETQKAYRMYRESHFKSYIYKSLLKTIMEILSVGLMAGFLAYGFFWSDKGPEFAIVFLAIFYRLVPRIQAVQDAFYTANLDAVWLSRLDTQYRALASNQETDSGKNSVITCHTLSFNNVDYNYEADRSVLRNINFTVEKGEITLLSGDSGSGKSTLIDLTLGLIQPTNGSLTLDGVPLHSFSLSSWRAKIGLVLQGSPIFYGTMLDNIALMDPKPDREKALRCADMADCLSFIQKLPNGIDTLIQEKGSRLSGGQRQRLALARALYRDPWILILDEPTSELDGESQARIIKTLTRLKGNYAILMSSHRAETLSIADKILKLPAGTLEIPHSRTNA
jgi:ABC-type bacteriocin/lantibiotic exporter with double-glycine peptidase domain